ncbi:MAG: hypothetical protein ABIH29_02175 [Candidatus Micrarchaeota archaeon]
MERKLLNHKELPKERPSSHNWAKAAAALLTAPLALLPCCSLQGRRPVAPTPSQVRVVHNEERDWYALGSNINDSSEFRPFEGILQEIGGMLPVPAERVYLVTNEELERICSPDAGGCYRRSQQDIYIGEGYFTPGQDENQYGTAHCKIQERPSLRDDNRLDVWAHEQGHHFDDYLGTRLMDRWPNEIEAEAFVLYFGEHLALHYDRRLGIDLIHVKFSGQLYGEGISTQEEAAELAQELIDDYRNGERNSHRDTTLGRLSIIALLGSGEFDSFGSLWYYVHANSHGQVMRKVRQNLLNMGEGLEVAERLQQELIGAHMQVSDSFDAEYLTNLDLGGYGAGELHEPPYHYTDEELRVDGFIWSNGVAGVHFRHFSNTATGYEMWRLRIRDNYAPSRTPLSRYDIYLERDGEGATLRFYDNAAGEVSQSLEIPDLSRNRGLITAGSNPLELTFCALEHLEVDVNPSRYLNIFTNMLRRLRTVFERIDSDEAREALEYLDAQVSDILGNQP